MRAGPRRGGRYFKPQRSENVLAFGNNDPAPWIRRLIQRNAVQPNLDYVNETRAFVMEPGFPSWAGLCETVSVKRSIHLCRLLAVFLIVGLVIRPALGAGECGR